MTIRGHSVPLTLCEHCFSHKSNAVADPHGLATARWAPSGPCFLRNGLPSRAGVPIAFLTFKLLKLSHKENRRKARLRISSSTAVSACVSSLISHLSSSQGGESGSALFKYGIKACPSHSLKSSLRLIVSL